MKDPVRLERYQRWKAVLGTQQGQSVLEDLKKMTGQDSTTAVLNALNEVDSYGTILREGRRSIWLDIQNCLIEPPDLPEKDVDGSDKT